MCHSGHHYIKDPPVPQPNGSDKDTLNLVWRSTRGMAKPSLQSLCKYWQCRKRPPWLPSTSMSIACSLTEVAPTEAIQIGLIVTPCAVTPPTVHLCIIYKLGFQCCDVSPWESPDYLMPAFLCPCVWPFNIALVPLKTGQGHRRIQS